MKKRYRIISNGNQYKIQRFYSWFRGVFKFTKTYDNSYLKYIDAEIEMNSMKKARKFYKEQKKKAWKVTKTFFD